MKKIVFVLLVVLMISVLALTVGAEEVGESSVEQEGMAVEQSASTDFDYSAIAKQFASYIQSEDAPEELIDSIIAIGEEMKEQKGREYTLRERVLQLVSSENVLKTVAALFMIIGSVLFFLIRQKMKNSGYDIEDTLLETKAVREALEKEKEARESGEEELKACRAELSELKTLLQNISQNVQKVGNGSIGVARMVKDVFLNSRTLDADGKSLMTHNFIEAVGELNGGQNEQQREV